MSTEKHIFKLRLEQVDKFVNWLARSIVVLHNEGLLAIASVAETPKLAEEMARVNRASRKRAEAVRRVAAGLKKDYDPKDVQYAREYWVTHNKDLKLLRKHLKETLAPKKGDAALPKGKDERNIIGSG